MCFRRWDTQLGGDCGGAVVRNSLRRRAREVARSEAPTLPAGTYLLRLEPRRPHSTPPSSAPTWPLPCTVPDGR